MKKTNKTNSASFLRAAAGFTAVAACVCIAGGLGMTMYKMQQEKINPAAQLEEQKPVLYPAYFAEYYEKRAGHPVDFDFSRLTGTDLDETWEFETSTVHLVAAISDGWTLNYLYTVTPKGEWECTVNNVNQLPCLDINTDGDPDLPGCTASNATNSALIDRELREDGSLLCLGTVRVNTFAVPLSDTLHGYATPLSYIVRRERLVPPSDTLQGYANCYEHSPGDHDGNTDHPVSFNIPAEKAECKPLVFAPGVDTLEAVGRTYTHSIVTPLGVILTNYDTADVTEILRDAFAGKTNFSSTGTTASKDTITVNKALHQVDDPQPAAITYGDINSEFSAVGDYALITVSSVVSADEEAVQYNTCWLPFTEPQNLDDVMFLQLYTRESLAENKLAACAVVGDAEPDIQSEPAAMTDDREFPLFSALTNEQLTKTYEWGSIYVLEMGLTEDGRQMECHIRVNVNDNIEVSEDDKFSIRLIGRMNSGDMQHKLISELDVTEMQISDPHSTVYRIVFAPPEEGKVDCLTLGEDGEYHVQAGDDFLEKQPMPEYLLYELELTDFAVQGSDGSIKAQLLENGHETLLKARLEDLPKDEEEPVFPDDYPAIMDMTAEQSTREFEFGTVIVDGFSTDNQGNPMVDIGIYPNGAFEFEDGQVLAVRCTAFGHKDGDGTTYYEMYNDECKQGAKWYYTDLQFTDGSFHMHLGLDPRCCAYSQNEYGEFVTDQESVTVDWTKLDIQLFLNALCVKNGPMFEITDDVDTYANENTYECWTETTNPWQFRFGDAPDK